MALDRVTEPELMDEEEQARAYDQADFEEPNARYVRLVEERLLRDVPHGGLALDLGCGPAEIPLRLLALREDLRIRAIDGSSAMLECARERREAVDSALGERLELVEMLLPAEPAAQSERADAVISNSLLHHLHNPAHVWQSIRALAKPGAPFLLADLRRPSSHNEVDQLVASYAAGEPDVLRHDFRASLYAAFTPDEVREQLREEGFDDATVEVISDRHLLVVGHVPQG